MPQNWKIMDKYSRPKKCRKMDIYISKISGKDGHYMLSIFFNFYGQLYKSIGKSSFLETFKKCRTTFFIFQKIWHNIDR